METVEIVCFVIISIAVAALLICCIFMRDKNKELAEQLEAANWQIEQLDKLFVLAVSLCEKSAKEVAKLKQQLLEVTAERDALQKSVNRIMRPIETIQPRGITE